MLCAAVWPVLDRRIVLFLLIFVGFVAPATAVAAPPAGAAIYAKRCAVCHDRPGETRAPARSVLENMTVERIIAVINTGKMRPQASAPTETERKALAAFLSSKHGSADAASA